MTCQKTYRVLQSYNNWEVDRPGHRWPIGHFLGLSCFAIYIRDISSICLIGDIHKSHNGDNHNSLSSSRSNPESQGCPHTGVQAGEKGPSQFLQFSSLIERRGELVRDVEKSLCLLRISRVLAATSGLLCFILTCCRSHCGYSRYLLNQGTKTQYSGGKGGAASCPWLIPAGKLVSAHRAQRHTLPGGCVLPARCAAAAAAMELPYKCKDINII